MSSGEACSSRASCGDWKQIEKQIYTHYFTQNKLIIDCEYNSLTLSPLSFWSTGTFHSIMQSLNTDLGVQSVKAFIWSIIYKTITSYKIKYSVSNKQLMPFVLNLLLH